MSMRNSANISGVVNSRRSSRLLASLAACRRMNCTLALRSKAALSKSAGMALGLASPEPICDPICEPLLEPGMDTSKRLGCCVSVGFNPAAAYCMPPGPAAPCCCAAARLRITMPTTASTAMTARPINSILAKPSPKPKCDARAARPNPAARPASGPIHDRLGAAAAAAPGAAAVAAVALLGACAGVAPGDLSGDAVCFCMPTDLPPPRRFAASASLTPRVSPSVRTAIK